ncbi:neutral zinc metallopeptidase [Actinoplanes sp. G11-F43]|uniref:neutral zinc metallopeptidase n=1 Tax=Actinoplanes sp. G11-F43 TaxID=3424130 RepID=UPI003D3295A7
MTTQERAVAPGSATGDVAMLALSDVERFWSRHFPSIAGGATFEPVRDLHPYTESDPPPACGPEPVAYQPNAFYCPAGDFIAWDAQNLIPELEEQFGPLLTGVIMAHEYGHALQSRLGRLGEPTIVLEQQADCFAGAWTADVVAGRSTAYDGVTPDQLDNTLAGLLMLRDQPGTSATSPDAHGNAFDRIRAFQDGTERGPAACAVYEGTNIPVTQVPFTSPDDAANGGDLPYAEALTALARDAQSYWARAYPRLTGEAWKPLEVTAHRGEAPACADPDMVALGHAFYCVEGDFATFDTAVLGPRLHRTIGDFAVGMLIGDLYARAVQNRRGAVTGDRAGQLAADCLAGTWTHDILTRDDPAQGLLLSPGDLDEAVAALLVLGRAGDGSGTTAFERIAAYRSGVIEGLPAC